MTEASNLPVLDHSLLEEVTGGDAELIRELATLYVEDGEARLPDLAGAVDEADFTAMATLAHALKGASASMGAVEAAHYFKLLEEAGRTSSADGIAEAMAGATGAFHRAAVALKSAA